MSKTRDPDPPLNTFVVRFWRERVQSSDRWHGQVLHIQSGENATFTDEQALMLFMRQWVRWNQERDETAADM